MTDYIDIDTPIDLAVYQRNRRIQVTLRQIFESNDAKYQTADVREVVRGVWKLHHKKKDGIYSEWCVCSVCGQTATAGDCYFNNETPFCPWCGADMREEQT